MKTCAVSSCGNDSYRRPDLSYFSLPKSASIRGEWIEALGKTSNSHSVFVCELHFRAKDFRSERRKGIKVHAVPVLLLGKGQADAVDSEDEFFAYGSGSDNEMVEVSKPHTISPENKKNEQEVIESTNIKEEPKPEAEFEVGRRPSRRAALVAAKKISNIVSSSSLKDDSILDSNANIPQKPATKTEKAQKPRKSLPLPPPEPIDISLDMECDEEILSETQAETLSKAQTHYNLVMKGLRELVQCNVKVKFVDVY